MSDPFIAELAAVAAPALGVAPAELLPHIKPGSDAARGDYALPLFPFARTLKRNPAELAAQAAAAIRPAGLLARAEAAGGYLNFFLAPGEMVARVVRLVLEGGGRYGASHVGAGQVVVIDYSSPNVAKHLAFHHIRSTMIGNALVRILRSQGYAVHGLNFLGDWGMSFAKLIVALERYGIPDAEFESDAVTKLNQIYVRFSAEAKQNPELDDTARAVFTRLEAGDTAMLAKWRRIREVSLEEFQRLYARLGVAFEDYTGEAAYGQAEQDAVIARLESAGLTSVDDKGRLVVDLSARGIDVPCILRKSDGASLYATRDLAAAFDRQHRFGFHQALYVVDMGQSLHFSQWFAVLDLLGEPWAKGLKHLAFGVVVAKEGGRLRTREGGAVLLADVLDQSVARVREIIAASEHTELADPEEITAVAEAIGIGAVVFNDLKTARVKDVKFDLDEILATDGYTAPYIQYAHARIAGIYRKAGVTEVPRDSSLALLEHPAEVALARQLARYPESVARAARDLEPSVIAAYLHDLATDLSRFYHDCRVLCDDSALRNARLALIAAVRIVLANGLDLLGIKAPTRI